PLLPRRQAAPRRPPPGRASPPVGSERAERPPCGEIGERTSSAGDLAPPRNLKPAAQRIFPIRARRANRRHLYWAETGNDGGIPCHASSSFWRSRQSSASP